MAQVLIFSDCLASGFGRTLGPYRLATELRRAGYSTQVVEFYSFYTRDEITKILDKYVTEETLVVGVSVLYLNEIYQDVNQDGFVRRQFPDNWYPGLARVNEEIDFMRFVFSESKKRNPKCKAVIGAGQIEDMLKFDTTADYFVTGAADQAILDLVRHVENPSNPLITTEGPIKIVQSDRDYPFERFNESKISYEKTDLIFPSEVLSIEFSRGCIFKCGFCEFPGTGKKRGTNQKTEPTFREELLDNYERFGVTDYIFVDNLLNDDPIKMKALHNVITKLPFKIRWHSFARIDLYTRYPEMMTLAKEMGCISHFFGIETFSKNARKKLGKSISPEQDIETMHKLKEVFGPELNIFTSLIAGLPGETWEDLEKTVEWLISGKAPIDGWGFNPLYVDRTSSAPFAVHPERYGIRFPDPNDDLYWETDITNAREVKGWATELLRRSAFFNRISGFTLFRTMNLGFKFEEARNISLVEGNIMQDEFLRRTLKLKSDYYSKLMAH